MDLAELKFVVDTKQLELAAKKVAELGAEVSKLNKPMQDLSNNTNKVSTATEKAAKAADNKAKADTKLVDNSSKLDGLLDKLNNRYTDMAKGSTSAEASVLQLARTLGATTESALKPYKDILDNIRELSKSPFDSAIGSVRSITQEYDSLTYRAELASKGIFLTTNQLKEYSRIANEIKGKLKAADLDPTKGEGLTKFNSELKIQQDLYLGIANKVNTLKTAEKERNDILNLQMKESARLQEASDNLFKYNLIRHKQDQDGYKQDMLEMRKYYSDLEKQSKQSIAKPVQMDAAVDAYRRNQAKAADEAAKANAYLAKEMERVNRLNSESGEVTSVTNNRLIRFEQELKKSGATAEQQAAKLAIYRKELIATQKAAGDRQIDYLSRALGPQITDIAVGLATGQAPLTILLQQGGQLRDQFALAGVAGADMGKMLTKATVGMVGSVKDVALAIGSALGGAFLATGKSVKTFMMDITGTSSALEYIRYQIALLDGSNGTLMKSFLTMGNILTGVIATAIFSAVAAFIAYGVALKEVIAQESALSKAVNLTGGSLGLTTNSALSLSKELAGTKGNVGSYVTAITEIAKAGNITSDNLKTVATTIVEVSKITGISADTLAKNFSKISEKPLEGLIPFAKELGTINVEILKQIQGLEKSGKYTEAANLATEAYAKALKDVSATIKQDMGAIETIFYGVGSAAKSMWDSILNVGRKGDLEGQMKEAVASLIEAREGKAWYSRFGRTNEEEVKYYEEIVQSLGKQINAQKELGDVKAKNAKDVTKFERDLKQQGGANFKVPEDLYLKRIKEEYSDATKTIDSEFKKLLADNKTNYDLGIIELGTYLSNENALILQQNNQKIQTNSDYVKSLTAARDIQLRAIDDMVARESTKNKTIQDAEKLQKEHKDSINSTKEAYAGLTSNIITNNEVLKDKSIEEQLKSLARLGSLTKKVVEDSKEFIKSIDDTASKRKLQIELENQLASLSGAELARVKAQIDAEQNHIAKLSSLQKAADEAAVALAELSLQGLSADPEQYAKAENAIKVANKRIEEAKSRSRQEIVEAGIDAEMIYYTQEYKKLKLLITDGVADSIVTGLIEGGEAGSKQLRKLIEAELRKPITIIVKAAVDMLMGNSGSSNVKQAMNLYNTGSSLFSIGSQVAAGTMSIANAGSTLFANATGGGLDALLATNGAYGTAAGSAGAGAAGSSGFAANAAAAGPYVLAAIVALNALGAFRTTKQVGGGISGTLGEGDINSYATMRKSGTLFRGPSYWRENRGEFSGSDALQATFADLKDSTTMMAEAIGASSDDIAGYTKKIEISFDGLTDAQIQDQIATTFKDVGNELAALVLGAGATAEQLSSLYNTVMQQRYDLETKLLELQGDTVALRERERAKIYDSNKALYDQIAALEDKKVADEQAVRAMEKLTSVTTGIVDEINRLRGVNTNQSGLESQFAILTAQARSGDLTALAKLPEITKGLEQVAASTAVNATDIIFARARLAQSLQDTLGYTGGFNASSTTSMATIASVSASGASVSSNVSSNSSNQELLAALVTEIQGLRAEVRADVSHNAKTAKILERVNQDGESLTITTLV